MKNLKRVFGFAIFFIILANVIGENISKSKISCKALCRLTCITSSQLDFCIDDVCMKRCKNYNVYQAMIHFTSCYENCSNIKGIISIFYIDFDLLNSLFEINFNESCHWSSGIPMK